MNGALRWILYGALGVAAGLITYFVALRWFPYTTIRDLIGPIPKESAGPKAAIDYMMKLAFRPPMTTLGTTYGNVAYFLLGATMCGGIVGALRWERSGPLAGLGWAFLAFFLGGAVSRGADALSDLTMISMGFLGNMVPGLLWSFLVGMSLAVTIGFLQGPTPLRMKRALVAGLVTAIVAHAMRTAAAPLGEIGSLDAFEAITDPRQLETVNLWEHARIPFLVEYLAMGLSLGLSFAYVETRLRRATLRLELGRNEGETWELPPGPIMLGSAEGLPIRLPARLGVAPRHASLVPHTEHGLALTPEPGQTVATNGKPTAGEWLRHGDRIGLGKATLVYEEANAPRTYTAPAPKAAQHWVEISDGRRIGLADGVSVLGNAPGNAVPLPFPAVAPRHAEIRLSGGRAMLADLGSGFGTSVAGQPVTVRELRDGDVVQIGAASLTYRRA